MSTDWDVFCLDCGKECGISNANHADDGMLELIRFAPALQDLSKHEHGWRIDVEIKVCGQLVFLDFFRIHGRHNLVPRSEYGEILASCAEPVHKTTCQNCVHKCVLPRKHDGEHKA